MAVAGDPKLGAGEGDRPHARDRVLLRAVRRPLRAAEREARAGREPRRPRRGGRRVRGLRGGRDRPAAERPGHRGDPRPRQLHARAVAAEPRALRLRRHGRGRAVAVLPAHDPAPQLARARSSGTSSSSASSSSTSSSGAREDGSIEIADAADTLEKPCYDMAGLTRQLRLPHHRVAVLQRARLGQLRERPRGRERPVRAELHLRRRARQLRPRDLLPLHGPHARGAARDDRDVHAEAVHAPDRGTAATSTCRSGATARTSSSTRPTRAGSACPKLAYSFIGGLKAHARASSALTAPTVNSYKRLKHGSTVERRDLGAGLDLLRLQQPHADAPDPGPGRVEDRTIDGSANPYLAAAAVLAAGLDGIANELDAGRARTRTTSTRMSLETLTDARPALAAREPARGDRRARARRRAAQGARAGARRGLRRLLRAA